MTRRAVDLASFLGGALLALAIIAAVPVAWAYRGGGQR